jgi:hypothetical protein
VELKSITEKKKKQYIILINGKTQQHASKNPCIRYKNQNIGALWCFHPMALQTMCTHEFKKDCATHQTRKDYGP